MGDDVFILHYDWMAVGRLREHLGSKGFDAKLQALADGSNPKGLAEVIAIGLQRNHEGITATEVLDFAPPLVPTVEGMNVALELAFYGGDGQPPDGNGTDPTKGRTSSKRRGKQPSAAASGPTSSGG